MKIREAGIEDLGEIQELFRLFRKKEAEKHDNFLSLSQSFFKEVEKKFKGRIKNKDNYVLLVEDKGKVVGYSVGTLQKSSNYKVKKVHLDGIYIEKEYQDRGVGTKMIEMIKKWAKKKGAKIFESVAFSKNKKAINFYKKSGFKEQGIIFNKKLD